MIYQETPTGTIDGLNTTFTTANTMQEVLYVVSDGSLTENYTASGTTLTMTTAPSSSLIITYDDVAKPTTPRVNGVDLDTIKLALNRALGTSETNFYTEDKRTAAINDAIINLLEQYPIAQYTRNYTEMNFSGGICPLPTDFLAPVKLWNTSTNREYSMINQNDFDRNVSYTYTRVYDETYGVDNLKIYPANTVTLKFRYMRKPEALSNAADKVYFPDNWTDAIAHMAAYYLLLDARSDAANVQYATGRDRAAKAWQKMQATFISPENNQLRSAFSKKSLLSNYGSDIHG